MLTVLGGNDTLPRMAIIEPFRALRFSPAEVPDMTTVTAPPYDVIGAELHRELLAEPRNIVHLDLPEGPADLHDSNNRYRTAARVLGQWRDAGILRRDSSPALYFYEQTYRWAGTELTRRGFIARVRLEPLGENIHPHERTFSGPKLDRFNLTVETRCNLSQVLGIYPDPQGEVMAGAAGSFARRPEVEAVGRDGAVSRVWVETEPAAIAAVQGAMASRPLTIADGHHRYETALKYRSWLEEMEALPVDHPAHYTTFLCVSSSDPGLRVMPTHRVLSGLRGFDPAVLRRDALARYEWQPVDRDPGDGAALDAWIDQQPLDALGLLTRDGVALLKSRAGDPLAAALPDASATLRGLNVSLLHRDLLPELVEPLFGAGHIDYVHQAAEAVERVRDGADLAVLLRATPLETILEVAANHEVMPQKSTYFYPKVLTGLVLYPLLD